ncbi:hypothetical protein Gasu_07150 isoform 2 [Galdieria sulphuraria]|uniref:HIT-type domain-containing protein n=1 Tax=Galdieria sulphuraria TaxID=130081 RepID=M2W7Z7_GALSU|nr:hypothetical protein Gasu_07150 isoform 2 [Galdieria sulphuraria]EME31966.1 hypothetical protein Gasu_07150 isoform 2 [Galdieria sulphuraria]|eukprot:XP_005708486.1 hypothetical protein isoform 2 [Galdieria sulphuraria]
MTASNATCAVCKKPARYKLPKTEVPYCSVVCFRQLSQLGNTVASSLNPDGESSVVPLPPASESFQTAKGEVDEERDKQFLQLAQSTFMQEFLRDKSFCQELQGIAQSEDPIESLALVRRHEKFVRFERVVFSFFNITDDQV